MILDDEKIDFIQAFQIPGTSDAEVCFIYFFTYFSVTFIWRFSASPVILICC